MKKNLLTRILSITLLLCFIFNASACGLNMPYSADKIYNLSKDSIGEIVTYKKNGAELALGTGFVYSADGKIITNYHVIENAYTATITISNSTYVVQSILAYDKGIDIAVLQINANNLTPLTISNKTQTTGKTVYTFGSSMGLTNTFSRGIITYADREIDGVHYVQHDAAISSGNSGGPLINEYGEVIGINTMTMLDSQNLNFAISVNELSNLTYETTLSFTQFYEKECDVFSILKDFILQEGTYDYNYNDYTLHLGSTLSSNYTSIYNRYAEYDPEYNEITLVLFDDSSSFDCVSSIYIDKIDGIYEWAYLDDFDNYMTGTLYASTFSTNSLLGYSYQNMYDYSLIYSVRELASSMISLLLTFFDTDFYSIGVTASDLGFVYF